MAAIQIDYEDDHVPVPVPATHKAIIRGDVKWVSESINPDNVNLTTGDVFLFSHLSLACMAGNLEIVNLILSVPRVNVDQIDAAGNTPLHYAANIGNIAIMQLLLDHKANLNIRNKHGETPIFLALKEPDACIGSGTPEMHHPALSFLINSGASLTVVNNARYTPLYVACELGDNHAFAVICFHVIKLRRDRVLSGLTPHQAMIGTDQILNCDCGREDTLLINRVTLKRQYENLRRLIATEACPNKASPIGDVRPLDLAIVSLDVVSMGILLAGGANPTQPSHGLMPIEDVYDKASVTSPIERRDGKNFVAETRALKAAAMLIAAGARDPSMKSAVGDKPFVKPRVSLLEMAAMHNNPCLVILAFIINLEYALIEESEMLRLVFSALEHGHEDVAEMLLLFGPRLNGVKTDRGESVFSKATKCGCRKLLAKLPALNAARQAQFTTRPTTDPFMRRLQHMNNARAIEIPKHDPEEYPKPLEIPLRTVPGISFTAIMFELMDMVNAIIQ